MSKLKLAYQFAGGVIGLVSLNLAFTPTAHAGTATPTASYPAPTNCSNCSGATINNGSNASGYYQYYVCSTNCGYYYEYVPFNASNSSGYNAANPTGSGFYVNYTNAPNGSGVMFYPYASWQTASSTNGSNATGTNVSNATGGNVYTGAGVRFIVNPNDKASAFFSTGSGSTGNYGASNSGQARQVLQTLNTAASDYGDKSAAVAAIQSQSGSSGSSGSSGGSGGSGGSSPTPPSGAKDPVRYSRVADANADCGCNANAAAPETPVDNSAALAAAKKAQAEAAASLAKAQQQAREFLEAQKKIGNNLANGTAFSPIW